MIPKAYLDPGHIENVPVKDLSIAAASSPEKRARSRAVLYTRVLHLETFRQDDVVGEHVSQSLTSEIFQTMEGRAFVKTSIDDNQTKVYTLTDEGKAFLHDQIRGLYQCSVYVFVQRFDAAAQEEVRDKYEQAFPMVDFDEAASRADLSMSTIDFVNEAIFGVSELAQDAAQAQWEDGRVEALEERFVALYEGEPLSWREDLQGEFEFDELEELEAHGIVIRAETDFGDFVFTLA